MISNIFLRWGPVASSLWHHGGNVWEEGKSHDETGSQSNSFITLLMRANQGPLRTTLISFCPLRLYCLPLPPNIVTVGTKLPSHDPLREKPHSNHSTFHAEIHVARKWGRLPVNSRTGTKTPSPATHRNRTLSTITWVRLGADPTSP